MQFLRTLFWVALAVLVAIVANNNWTTVTLSLWGGQLLETKIPVLMAFMFLIGFLPTFLILRGKLWQVKRRLVSTERSLEMSGQIMTAGEPVANEPAVVNEPAAAP